MKVIVTGSEGYIGAVLRDVLLKRGHEVTGMDTGYFNGCDFDRAPTAIPLIKRDLRRVQKSDLEGFDAVVHLAALSNDPLGNVDASLTQDINTTASIRMAELAKEAGVGRFLFSSSCSLYGASESQGLTEEAQHNPQTPYAQSKVDVELALQDLASDNFSPAYFRNATAYGVSPRLRFDLVVNNLCGWAWTTGKIRLTSDGTPWRPLVHILDISKAFACALDAPREAIHNQAFNVGSNANNLQVIGVARKVRQHFPECEVLVGQSDGDTRTYNVDFTKINTRLPGWDGCDYSVDDAILEFKAAFERMSLSDETFQSRMYTRLKQIKYLQDEGRLDERLYWTTTEA